MFYCFEEEEDEVAAPITEELPDVPIVAPISIVVGIVGVAGTPTYGWGADKSDEDGG